MDNDNSSSLEPTFIDGVRSISKKKLVAVLFLGSILYVVVAFVSLLIPFALFGLPKVGIAFIVVGLIQLIVGLCVIAFSLRFINLKFRDVGLTTEHLGKDSAIGVFVAIVFALLQFLVIIPNTGGAERSDIVVASSMVEGRLSGVIGIFGLAWTSVFFEELFFRGFFFTVLRCLLGPTRLALSISVVVTVVFFGALHGYQGWSGVIDTALYGGLTLTLLYVWSGRLTACIVAHALWNTLAVVGVYLWY